jgi:hypothetical protein
MRLRSACSVTALSRRGLAVPRGMYLLLLLVFACTRNDDNAAARHSEAAKDSSFAGVQARGGVAMGVDQYTSSHIFQPLRDGGRIELQRDSDDSAGTAQIRRHMEQIAVQFSKGDFRLPGFVHAETVPGTATMGHKRAAISYVVDSLPRGAALRLRSSDPEAIRAIHDFLAFQRSDHHAPGQRDP